MVSPLQNAIDFLQDFGFFDIVLPFLLVFTLVFGILEKTKIFGTEKVKGEDVPRRNINSMVAFVVAFFVIAATKIVKAIQESLPLVAMVLIVVISLMLLVGSLASGSEEFSFSKHKTWFGFLGILIGIGVLAIFLHAVDWLEPVLNYIERYWQNTLIPSLILLAVIIGTVFYVVRGEKKEG